MKATVRNYSFTTYLVPATEKLRIKQFYVLQKKRKKEKVRSYPCHQFCDVCWGVVLLNLGFEYFASIILSSDG